MRKPFLALAVLFITTLAAWSQDMDFEAYDPPSTLVVPEHVINRARYPFIDVHNHQFGMANQDLSGLTAAMDKLNMRVMVNLSGRGRGDSEHLRKSLENARKHPGRFIVFTNVDFDDIDDPQWTARTVRQLEENVKLGASGLKIYKELGMNARDSKNNRIKIDDPRIGPVWEKCGELGIPMLIHSADPKPFWDPMDENNERWLELKTRPGRKRGNSDPAPWETIIAEQHNIFRKHPRTIFINAHLGWYGNNLQKLKELMDQFPNMQTERSE